MTNWIRLYLETSIFFHNLHAVHDHPQGSCTPLHVARPFDRLAWRLGRTKRRPSGEDSQLHLTRSQTSSDTRKNVYVWANLILHWWVLIHEVVYQLYCTCVYMLFVCMGWWGGSSSSFYAHISLFAIRLQTLFNMLGLCTPCFHVHVPDSSMCIFVCAYTCTCTCTFTFV